MNPILCVQRSSILSGISIVVLSAILSPGLFSPSVASVIIDNVPSKAETAEPRYRDKTAELALNSSVSLDVVSVLSFDYREDVDSTHRPLYITQVTTVDQISDIFPGDWAFQAVRSLVDRYGCLQGYPDFTFRGNQAMRRDEFAAALATCLDTLNRITLDLASDETLETLETITQLQRIFGGELVALDLRVESLESQVQQLRGQAFSTTTRLFGQAVVGLQGRTANQADFFPVDGQRDLADPGTAINVITNAQLSLLTQFSPRSLLLLGLQAGDGSTAPRLTNDVRLSYESDTNADLILSDFTYRHLIGDDFAIVLGPTGISPVSVFRGANRVESAGFGTLSAFAQRNPIINIGAGQGGMGFDWQLGERAALQGVYATTFPADPALGGLFGGETGGVVMGTQLNVAPTPKFDIALNHLYAYTPGISFGGRLGTGIGDDQVTVAEPLNTHALGGTVNWRMTPRLVMGGWFGYTTSRIPGAAGTVETVNWMGYANLPDLFREGDMGGFYVGQPPRITASNLPIGRNIPNLLAGGSGMPGGQPGRTIHLEAFYRYPLTPNMTITPGLIAVFNPSHTPSSDTILLGALRTTFSF